MGDGPIITHPRDMLNSPTRNQANVYLYGTISKRYRYGHAKYVQWWDATYIKTTTGRIVERDTLESRSGRTIKKSAKSQDTAKAPLSACSRAEPSRSAAPPRVQRGPPSSSSSAARSPIQHSPDSPSPHHSTSSVPRTADSSLGSLSRAADSATSHSGT
ncbi:uncharacterized protein C8A04DRAFT_26010 [Dichotomopilus funicola]|uniref:Uncharacterized protein n=1 Tax=Dichotomopilus funicola TaxID=1934379 RepID=A0AAN6V7E6_9PEZI|nr:hypothetical protein C8A04DRAFT_26010 [Dichotomopilus funicola]